jgi:hypothetical protein
MICTLTRVGSDEDQPEIAVDAEERSARPSPKPERAR